MVKEIKTNPEHGPNRSMLTVIFYCRIKHGSFPSSCLGDNHWTVLELLLI